MNKKIKPIIKLRKNFKFPKNLGISLLHLSSTPRHSFLKTASTLSFDDVWFNINGKQALYKTFDYNGLKEFRKTNEIVCYELAKQLKIPCVEYEYAHLKKSSGVITYNVLKKNQKIISGQEILLDNEENIFSNYVSALFDYMEIYKYNGDIYKLINQIYEIAVFDLLTFQTDRHKTNINFIIEDNKNLKLFPLFDNEYAFGTKVLEEYTYFNSEKISLTTKQFLRDYNDIAVKICFSIRNYNDYIENVKSAVFLATRQKEYATFLKNTIKNLDIEKCLQTLKSKGYKFSHEQENIYKNCINLSKYIFMQEMITQKLIENISTNQKNHLNCNITNFDNNEYEY